MLIFLHQISVIDHSIRYYAQANAHDNQKNSYKTWTARLIFETNRYSCFTFVFIY